MTGSVAAFGIAVNATTATGSVHLMLSRLPNCFTVGAQQHCCEAPACTLMLP